MWITAANTIFVTVKCGALWIAGTDAVDSGGKPLADPRKPIDVLDFPA